MKRTTVVDAVELADMPPTGVALKRRNIGSFSITMFVLFVVVEFVWFVLFVGGFTLFLLKGLNMFCITLFVLSICCIVLVYKPIENTNYYEYDENYAE